MFDLFNEFNVSKDTQKFIIENGVVVYDFTHGYEQTRFGCLEFAKFLKFCKAMNIAVDVEKLVYPLWDEYRYSDLLRLFKEANKISSSKTNSKTR